MRKVVCTNLAKEKEEGVTKYVFLSRSSTQKQRAVS